MYVYLLASFLLNFSKMMYVCMYVCICMNVCKYVYA